MREDVSRISNLILESLGPGDVIEIADFLDSATDLTICELRAVMINAVDKLEGKGPSEKKTPDNFDVFEDRAKSLLKRWRGFKNKTEMTPGKAIQLCISEMTDDYTKTLIKEGKPKQE